jgi:hypothetical protein
MFSVYLHCRSWLSESHQPLLFLKQERFIPIFGVLGLLASLAFLVIVGLETLESHLGLIAFIAQVLFLVLYTMYSKPINVRMRQAARSKLVPADTRQMQERWDRVVVIRASLLFIAMACLFLAAVIL